MKKMEHLEVPKSIDTLEILSIKPINNVLLSVNEKPIPLDTLIWHRDGDKLNKMAVAFYVDSKNTYQFEVKLSSLKGISAGNNIYALSRNGEGLFSGIINSSNTIEVKSEIVPSQLSRLYEDSLYWYVEHEEGGLVDLGVTNLELYWVGSHEYVPALARKGIAVETLRLFTKVSPRYQFPYETIRSGILVNTMAQVLTYIFNFVPPRYDIWRGAPHFVTINGWNNITLHWSAYLNAHNSDPNAILNCYDAAAIAQYWLEYSGYTSSYCFMQPFGYLRQTPLIGRGSCNNPFYDNGGNPVVNPTDSSRTAFGNHAFVRLIRNYGIGDACAGPHLGTETISQYILSATDDVYPNRPRVSRGVSANVNYYKGVTSVNFIRSIKSLSEFELADDFVKMLNFSESKIKENQRKHVVGKWPLPTECPAVLGDWKIIHEELVPGNDEVLKLWLLKKENKMITVKIFVATDGHKLSTNRFLSLGTLYQNPDAPFETGPDDLASFSAINKNEAYSHCIWLFHNAVLEIINHDSKTDTLEMARYYYNWAIENLIDDITEYLPSIKLNYVIDEKNELKISLDTDEHTILEVDDPEGSYRLISAEDKTLTLLPLKEARESPLVLVINKDTLLVNKTTI